MKNVILIHSYNSNTNVNYQDAKNMKDSIELDLDKLLY